MRWFKRRPKRMRFPHGIPRIPVQPPPKVIVIPDGDSARFISDVAEALG